MWRMHSIRRWQRATLCGLLWVALHLRATAQTPQTQTATPATESTQTSSTASKKSTHHVAGKTVPKRASSHAVNKSRNKKLATKRGQQGIDSARAREIQQALIRQNYMQGEPSGSWDSATQAAMRRYQADHGWQSTTIPDSRALIRLGLGPSSDHLLNPESAMTTAPAASDPKADAKQAGPDENLPKP